MDDFKPAERTIVTETRSFLVDKHTRSPINRANQSAYIGTSDLTVTDVNVTASSHFTTRVSKHLTVVSPSPVILSLTSSGPITQPELPSSGYNDATIVVNDFIIGDDLVITVVDDTPLSAVNVVLLNTNTGETESITLTRQGDIFIGKINTMLDGTWTSFDGVLHPENDNRINIMYQDMRSANGRSKQIKTTVKAVSPYSDAVIRVPAMVRIGQPIGIVVQDRDLADSVGSIVVDYEVGTLTGSITCLRSERPYGTVFVATLDSSTIYMEIDDIVTFKYVDPRDANGFPKDITIQSIVVPNVNTTGEVIVPDFNGYGDYFLRLNDPDISGSSVQLIALNERTQSFIPVTCDETILGSGEFIGELTLSGTASPSELLVQANDVIRVTYVDLNTQSGQSVMVQETKPFTMSDVVVPPVDNPLFVPGTVDMQVDGLFTLFGSFVGTISIKGLSETPVRCNIIVA